MVCELHLNGIITEILKKKILICTFPYQRLLLVSHHQEIKPKLLDSPHTQKKSLGNLILTLFFNCFCLTFSISNHVAIQRDMYKYILLQTHWHVAGSQGIYIFNFTKFYQKGYSSLYFTNTPCRFLCPNVLTNIS